jgi:hypothetical protein
MRVGASKYPRPLRDALRIMGLLKIEDENYLVENGELTDETSSLYCLYSVAGRISANL